MSKAVRSNAFPNAYLRIDGTGVNAPISQGGGIVNCQSGVGAFELLEEKLQPDGTVAFASAAFPNVYLRMDGSAVRSANNSGAGTVNCQFGVGPWEKFLLVPAPPSPSIKSSTTFRASDYESDYAQTDAPYVYTSDYGAPDNETNRYDFIGTSQIGASASLGVTQGLDTTPQGAEVTLQDADGVQLTEETSQDPDDTNQDPDGN